MAMVEQTAVSDFAYEDMTETIKTTVASIVPRGHFKFRVAFRESCWFISVSVANKYRGEIPKQVQLPEFTEQIHSSLTSFGLSVKIEDLNNSDMDHVRWLMVAPDSLQLDAMSARRRNRFN